MNSFDAIIIIIYVSLKQLLLACVRCILLLNVSIVINNYYKSIKDDWNKLLWQPTQRTFASLLHFDGYTTVKLNNHQDMVLHVQQT